MRLFWRTWFLLLFQYNANIRHRVALFSRICAFLCLFVPIRYRIRLLNPSGFKNLTGFCVQNTGAGAIGEKARLFSTQVLRAGACVLELFKNSDWAVHAPGLPGAQPKGRWGSLLFVAERATPPPRFLRFGGRSPPKRKKQYGWCLFLRRFVPSRAGKNTIHPTSPEITALFCNYLALGLPPFDMVRRFGCAQDRHAPMAGTCPSLDPCAALLRVTTGKPVVFPLFAP